MFPVYYDGYNLADYMDITSVLPSVMPPTSNVYLGLPHRSGTKSQYNLYGQLRVDVQGTIKHNVLEAKDQLAKILHTRTDKPLVIGDQPERYLMCKPDGVTPLSSRYVAADVTLRFVSPDYFWRHTEGFKRASFDSSGRIIADNLGTAPTKPIVNVTFPSDCGYLAIVGANGFVSLGNAKEEDAINVPPSEYAVNDPMTSTTGWQRITNAQTLINDYIKLTSAGTAKHDSQGMQLNVSTLGTSDQWHGHAYSKDFAIGQAERYADNFNLRSAVEIADLSGNRNRSMAMLIVVMDENNNAIMTTSVYDVSGDKNELTVTFKVNDPSKDKHSKIIHTAKMPRLNGYINMEKSGNKFSWIVHNEATTQATPSNKVLRNNEIVHLTAGANTIYNWEGRKLTLDARIKGEPLRVGQELAVADNTPNKGRYLLRNVRYGYVEGFFDPKDIKETTSTQQTSVNPQTVRHTITDNGLAQFRPYKVFVWQAKWGATTPYSQFNINDLKVQRLYTTNKLELPNTFMAGDTLTVDFIEGEILHNGREYEGYLDVDSRFFDVDGGQTELELYPSAWAGMPTATLDIESRWF